jgi:hypothetical protein
MSPMAEWISGASRSGPWMSQLVKPMQLAEVGTCVLQQPALFTEKNAEVAEEWRGPVK